MPVELKKIPEAAALPIAPKKNRWIIFIILCIFTGFVLTLYFWPEEMSTHKFWFWMCALLIPSGVGIACYALRLRQYEQHWERVSYWNLLHLQKKTEMIGLGQQALGLLGMAYATPAANNKLASALLRGVTPLQVFYPPDNAPILTVAQLQPAATAGNEKEYSTRLEAFLRDVITMLDSELTMYAAELPISVRIRHDGLLDDNRFLNIWQKVFPERYLSSQICFSQQDDGLMWLDTWLDEQNSSLVLSLEVNLFAEVYDRQAESVSALLLASPGWLDQNKVIPLSWIHRPVRLTEAKEALEDVVLWGGLSAEEKYFIWRSQLPTEPQTEMLLAMDTLNYRFYKDCEHQLDGSFGKPAAAVGHIALICACDHAICTQLPQWLMLQDKTPQWAIVRPA